MSETTPEKPKITPESPEQKKGPEQVARGPEDPAATARRQLDELKENEDLPSQLTDADKQRYEKAMGERFDMQQFQNISVEKLLTAEEKDPGFLRMLMSKTGNKKDRGLTFNSRGNRKAEWAIGLRDMADEHARAVVLKIHPKNLTKADNKTLLLKYPEAKRVYEAYKKTGAVEYFERKSTERRGSKGDFFNEDGYLRIFSGDQWHEENMMSDQELQTFKTSPEGKKNYPRAVSATASIRSAESNVNFADYPPITIDGKTPVVDQISVRARLSPSQRQMAQLIEQEGRAAGLSPNEIAAMIVNAKAESGLNPGIKGDSGHSIGLFQLNDRGAGHGMSVEERQDPITNIRTILTREVLTRRGQQFRSRAAAGASIQELAAIFSRDIERPADRAGEQAKRAALASRLFENGHIEDRTKEQIDKNNERGYV